MCKKKTVVTVKHTHIHHDVHRWLDVVDSVGFAFLILSCFVRQCLTPPPPPPPAIPPCMFYKIVEDTIIGTFVLVGLVGEFIHGPKSNPIQSDPGMISRMNGMEWTGPVLFPSQDQQKRQSSMLCLYYTSSSYGVERRRRSNNYSMRHSTY